MLSRAKNKPHSREIVRHTDRLKAVNSDNKMTTISTNYRYIRVVADDESNNTLKFENSTSTYTFASCTCSSWTD